MIQLDGSQGEGGGQILRTALTLSLCTGQPFRMTQIRAGRKKSGILRQHLTAIQAAEAISDATVSGAEAGSRQLVFEPGKVNPGGYGFTVGTAGSAVLVLQTVLPALMLLKAESTVHCRGGTHNPFAPSFDFMDRCLAPQLRKMGVGLELKLVTPGFYPAGGGEFSARITPVKKLKQLSLLETGLLRHHRIHIYLAHLFKEIGLREKTLLTKYFPPTDILVHTDFPESPGPGNVIVLEREHEHVSEVITSFGEKGVAAETVVRHLVEAHRAYVASGSVVGEYLADQLLLPMALARGGEFISTQPSSHCATNAQTIEKFLDCKIRFSEETGKRWRCSIE